MKEAKNLRTGGLIPLNDGRTLPIKFRIEQGAQEWAETCGALLPESFVTCNGALIPQNSSLEDRTVRVFAPGEGLGAIVTIPELTQTVKLTVQLLDPDDPPSDPNGEGGIPFDQQIPQFVTVTAVDLGDFPVVFDIEEGDGASITLCQDVDLSGDHSLLRLFRVDGGVTTLHPAIDTHEAPECAGFVDPSSSQLTLLDPHGTPTGHSRFDVLLDRGKRALAGLFLPQPLHAVHGGLNGKRITEFSSWGATVVVPPPAVTINDVTFSSTELVLYGAGVDFTVNISNGTVSTIGTDPPVTDRVVVQAILSQGGYDGAAGGSNVSCSGGTGGELPPGACSHDGTFYINAPQFFTPGLATARIELRHENQYDEWTTIGSYDVAVTLVAPTSSVIDFETLPGPLGPTPLTTLPLPIALSGQFASQGVEFSFIPDNPLSPTAPRLCASTGQDPLPSVTNHSVSPAGTAETCTGGYTGTIRMTFPGSPSEVSFRLRNPYENGGDPNIIVSPPTIEPLDNLGPALVALDPILVGSDLYTPLGAPNRWESRTVTVTKTVGSLGVVQIDLWFAGVFLIDNLVITP